MSSIKTFNISFPTDLADQVDKKAKQQFGSRSDFLRAAAIEYLRKEEKVNDFKKLIAEGRKFAKNTPIQSEQEVADEITSERRQREPWRQNLDEFKNRT